MNVEKLKGFIEQVKNDCGPGFLATDVYSTADGQSIAGYNSNPQACALMNKMSRDLDASLKNSDFPEVGNYYLFDLVDDKMVVIVTLADYQWGMLLDKSQVQLGLFLNIILPKAMDLFEEAITG